MSKRAGLRDSTIKLVAGAPEDIPADGNYLRISTAVYPLIVEVGGNDVYKLNPGQDVTYPIDEGFTRIRLSTLAPVDDLVTVTIGNNVKVGSVVLSGQVSIAGTPNMNLVNQPSVKVMPKDNIQSYSSNVALVAGATNIFTAASNVGGVEVFNIDHMSYAGSTRYMTYIAKATAPANISDGLVIASNNNVFVTGGGNQFAICTLKTPVFIPPGLGLWVYINATESEGIRTVNWR
jgi:hypothetical protein